MNSITKEVILCCLCWLIAIPLIPFITPLFCIFILYKIFVNTIVKIIHPTWTPLTSLDISVSIANDLYKSEGKLLSNVGAILACAEQLSITRVCSEFQKLVLDLRTTDGSYRYERLRQTVIKFMGHSYWRNANEPLSLENLIKEYGGTELEEFVANWIHAGYSDGNPMWELVIYKDKDKSVLMFKMAHSLGDGQSVMNVLGRLLGHSTPISDQDLDKINWIPWQQKILFGLMSPRILFQYFSTMIFHSDQLTRAPKVAEVSVAIGKIQIESVKKIRRAYGCKFSDVLLHLFGSTIRRCMMESTLEADLPKNIQMISTVAVPTHKDSVCNQFATLLVKIPIRNSNPDERLKELMLESEYLRKTNPHKIYYWLSGAIYWIPGFFLNPPKDFQPGVCCGMTSIPSIFEKYDLFKEYPVERIIPIAGMQMKQTGILASFATKGNDLNFGMLGNKSLFPRNANLEQLANYLEEELDKMLQLVETDSNSVPDFTKITLPVTETDEL